MYVQIPYNIQHIFWYFELVDTVADYSVILSNSRFYIYLQLFLTSKIDVSPSYLYRLKQKPKPLNVAIDV